MNNLLIIFVLYTLFIIKFSRELHIRKQTISEDLEGENNRAVSNFTIIVFFFKLVLSSY